MSTNITRRQRSALLLPRETDDELHGWVKLFMHMRIPRERVCPHHCSPFDYLCHTYFEPTKDCVVWAPRGGGKTRLAALATLLDLLHKPGCNVRILGGSMEQSLRMWEHLFPDLLQLVPEMLDSRAKNIRRINLSNGSNAAVLTQSQKAVRGLRVQKLRCDEVEMFKPEIWEAAQLVTKSLHSHGGAEQGSCGTPREMLAPRSGRGAIAPPWRGKHVTGAIEAISTFHEPWGLMSRIIENARARDVKVYQWCILDVLQRCEPERDCATCPLWNECKGIAKTKCNGYVSIDDAIDMKQRVSKRMWESEMLCLKPRVDNSVFPDFDRDVHVKSEISNVKSEISDLSLAVDFGFAAPFVCLWIRTIGEITHVIDEYIQSGVQLETHIEQIKSRKHGAVVRLSCDPSGAGRNDQTAASNVQLLRHHGFNVKHRKSRIVEGLEMVRAVLTPASGEPKLFIHPRCTKLIKALQAYHYPPGGGEVPEKDGTYDHPIDALRYHFVNRPVAPSGPARRY